MGLKQFQNKATPPDSSHLRDFVVEVVAGSHTLLFS